MRISDQELLEVEAMHNQGGSSSQGPATPSFLPSEYYVNDNASESDDDFCFVTDDISDDDEQYVALSGARGSGPDPDLNMPDGITEVPQKLDVSHINEDGAVRRDSDGEDGPQPGELHACPSATNSPRHLSKDTPGKHTRGLDASWHAANVYECKVPDGGGNFDCNC